VSSTAHRAACEDLPVPDQDGWTVVVPVKGGPRAKSRLGLPESERLQLAGALAEDTIEVVRRCSSVSATYVLTPDDATARWVTRTWPDVTVVRELPGENLNSALARGLRERRAQRFESSVAVVAGDLPALGCDDLTDLFRQATADGGVCLVPDRSGLGTTILLLPGGVSTSFCFGGDSAARHQAGGAHVVSAGDGARCDVDTTEDLATAATIGVGDRTSAVLEHLATSLRLVQATVRTFDPLTNSGSVLRDDGVELPFDADAFATSGLRLLRLGQRVRIATDASGRGVTSLTILTLA
jgi:2-phospho-L-lactate/phosphoenolpyruvate guanylyltransferase